MTNLGPNEYQCSACRGVFNKVTPDEVADAEALAVFGVLNASTNPDMAIVCDDCWNKMKWMWEDQEARSS